MQQAVNKNVCPNIKDYEIIKKIGQGGIAEIYKARQISLNRPVAIKILFPELTNDPDIVRRFDRESVVIARLNHPNIVHVIDKGQADGRYYFIMEYVDGTSFRELIHSAKISMHKKLDIIIMTLKGLDYAHKNGVIHRDIKPANILVDRQGNAQVADFGIAHIASRSPDIEVTSSDVVMGTMAYMSPEQKISSAGVDQTTDIYAVGVMIYEILVGKRPAGRFKLPSQINPIMPAKFDEIVKKCLAQEPKERFQKAVDLKNAILEAAAVTRKNHPKNSAKNSVKNGDAKVTSFVGKCQYLDTLKETRYSNTMLVENVDTHDLYVIKKNGRSNEGLKEAKMLANLKHKNIINIFGAGGDDRRLVIVMEYAAGGSLADRMVKPYPFDKAIKIISDVASALEFAQKSGIVHGNLRPSNVLFTSEEEVKVTDFGLPPHYNLMEKNWYAPPEKRVSSQGDVYSLGVILYRMLFEKNPIYDRSSNLFIGQDIREIPAGVDKILQKMLAIRVARRYRSVEEFLHDWDDIQKAMAVRRTAKKPVQKTTENTDNKKIAVIVSICVIIIAVLAVLFFAGVFN
jgi:serine/threonine-protein kinase